MQQTLTALLPFILPALGTLLAAVFAWLAAAIHRNVKNRTAQVALEQLNAIAAQVVASSAAQVRDLKDPAQPGTWGPQVAHAIKDAALASLLEAGRDQVAILSKSFDGAASFREFASRLIEAEVEKLKRGALAVEVAPVDLPVTPRPPSGQAGFARASLLLAVAIAMAVILPLGLALSGCPSYSLPPPSGCTPHAYRCSPEGRPEVCSSTQRWTPIGDVVCRDVHATCCSVESYGAIVSACVPESRCLVEPVAAPVDGGAQ